MESFKLSSSDTEDKKKEEVSPLAQGIIALMLLGGGGWYFLGGGWDWHTEKELDRINDQVAADFEAQYRIAQQGGDLIEICVQAQTVAAGYLQAQDQPNYLKWKEIQKRDCDKAGLSQ